MSLKLDLFRQDCINLAKSIVLKSDLLAKEVESVIDPSLSFLKTDRRTWKYYLNASGEYHSTNEVMSIVSLDTLTTIEFTKANLVNHPVTLITLREFGTTYTQFAELYPDERALIHGILYSVDIETIIAMDDYCVVGYGLGFVETQEIELINNLNRRLKKIGNMIGNSTYFEVEPGFVTCLMFHISQQVFIQLQLERYKVRSTSQAHSYYIWEHINSFVYLEDFADIITHTELIYLFKNIKYLHNGSGTKAVFKTLLERFVASRNLGTYQLSVELDDRKATNYPSVLSSVYMETPLVSGDIQIKEQGQYILEHLDRSNFKLDDYKTDLVKKVNHKNDHNKTPEVRVYAAEALTSEYSTLLTTIDAYFVFLDEGLITNRYSIANHVNGIVYSLTFRQALTLYLRVVQKRCNSETTNIPYMTTHQVSKTTPRLTSEQLQNDWGIRKANADIMATYIPEFPTADNELSKLATFITEFSDGMVKFKQLLNRSSHNGNEHKLYRIFGEYLEHRTITLYGDDNVNYEEWLTSLGINIGDVIGEDLEILESHLLSQLFQLDMDLSDSLSNYMAEFVSRFSAYRTNIATEYIPSSTLNYLTLVPHARRSVGEGDTIIGVALPGAIRLIEPAIVRVTINSPDPIILPRYHTEDPVTLRYNNDPLGIRMKISNSMVTETQLPTS